MGLREQILGTRREKVQSVTVGGDVGFAYVRRLTAAERDAFEMTRFTVEGSGRKSTQKIDLSNDRGQLLCRALSDENGVRLFTDDDAQELGKLPADLADQLYDAAMLLSGLKKEEGEGEEKNSVPSGASPIG